MRVPGDVTALSGRIGAPRLLAHVRALTGVEACVPDELEARSTGVGAARLVANVAVGRAPDALRVAPRAKGRHSGRGYGASACALAQFCRLQG